MTRSAILEPHPEIAAAGPAPAAGVERLLGLEIPITVCFGQREIPLRQLAEIGPGSLVELDRGASSPVDLLVNGQLVARGDLLLVDQQFAVRVTEVVSTGDRIRSLGRPREAAPGAPESRP